jgi:hypothetical protein
MTVTRKPHSVEDFINNSAVAAESTAQVELAADIQPVKLRMPVELLKDVDDARSKRKPRPSRHQYILEALYEKVGREQID